MNTGACPTRKRSACYNTGGSPRANPATIVLNDDGSSVMGAKPRTDGGGICSISDMQRDICVLEEKLVSAAVAAGADTVFSLQLRWWWQINVWVNVGDQVAETFALTRIQYGNEVPFFQTTRAFDGSTIDGAAYGAPNGMDIRRWNIEGVDTHWFPTPANAWQDPVEYTFTNNGAGAEDLGIEVAGPANLQIKS